MGGEWGGMGVFFWEWPFEGTSAVLLFVGFGHPGAGGKFSFYNIKKSQGGGIWGSGMGPELG